MKKKRLYESLLPLTAPELEKEFEKWESEGLVKLQRVKSIIDSCNGISLNLSGVLIQFLREQIDLLLQYAFAKWPKLKELNVSSNILTSLPDMSYFTCLEQLDVSESFFNYGLDLRTYTSLKDLSAIGCRLNVFPNTEGLNSLEKMNLRDN